MNHYDRFKWIWAWKREGCATPLTITNQLTCKINDQNEACVLSSGIILMSNQETGTKEVL